MPWDLVAVTVGVALLAAGGELLVRGSVRLARSFGVAPLVVGLTVVAFGTSSPELFTNLSAVAAGTPSLAFGNVVGSNIANLALILGIAALVRPLATTSRLVQREVPVMIAVAGVMALMLLDGRVGRVDGVVLVVLLVAYVAVLARGGDAPTAEREFAREYGPAAGRGRWIAAAVAALGLGLLAVGARALVLGATSIARGLGVPEVVVGLTLVALGTSLPELVTSLVAARRGEPDIATGNVVGSNVFNVLGILGVSALVRPIPMPSGGGWRDLAVMAGVSLLVWPFLRTGMRLGRREGAVLVALYAAYVVFLYASS